MAERAHPSLNTVEQTPALARAEAISDAKYHSALTAAKRLRTLKRTLFLFTCIATLAFAKSAEKAYEEKEASDFCRDAFYASASLLILTATTAGAQKNRENAARRAQNQRT